jgi:hypothetical protein
VILQFAKADPKSAGFQGEITTFEGRLQSLSPTLPEPFRKLHGQRLIAALRDEVTCVGIVQVG